MTSDPDIIRGLGEIALRVDDIDTMQQFYADVVGLPVMRRFSHATFFKIADGYAGHTQILALFDRSADPDYAGINPAKTSVDHIAFAIDLENFEAERQRLEGLGQEVRLAQHAWVHWRSLYITDPEGNTVELVCYDDSVQ